jgi:hypothetical protein
MLANWAEFTSSGQDSKIMGRAAALPPTTSLACAYKWQGIRALREDLHALRLVSEFADLWAAGFAPLTAALPQTLKECLDA